MKISALVAARKDSKYLAKFLLGALHNSDGLDETEFLVSMNAGDTWNKELVGFWGGGGQGRIRFFTEDLGLGRAGLYQYLNEMVPHARGDWIVYFCEDHFINAPGDIKCNGRKVNRYWDRILLNHIRDLNLDPREPWCIVPKFDNAGAMNHILSRGWIEALDGKIARHGWVDSYINQLNFAAFGRHAPGRVILIDEELFHDFTHDKPSPMSEAGLQSISSDLGQKLPKIDSQVIKQAIADDADKIRAAVERANQ